MIVASELRIWNVGHFGYKMSLSKAEQFRFNRLFQVLQLRSKFSAQTIVLIRLFWTCH